MARQKSKKGKSYRLDFTGTEGEPGRRRAPKIPEGDYIAKIVDVERKIGKESKKPYFNWKIQIIEDAHGKTKHAGVTFYYNTSLQPDALFNLRNFIFAASDGKKNVSGKALDFNPKSLKEKKIGVVVEDGEYKDKIRSEVVDIMPPSQVVSEEDDSEEDDSEDEEDSEDEDSEDDSEDEDESEEEDSEDESEDSDDSDDLEEVDV